MMGPAGTRARTGLVANAHRHVVWVIGILAVCAYVTIYAIPLAGNPVRSDGLNYFVYLPSMPLYDAIRHDPRFTALLVRMNLA